MNFEVGILYSIMMYFIGIVISHLLFQASACPDTITTVHIQNHDGPIYVSPNDRAPCDNQLTLNHGASSVCENRNTNTLHHINPYNVCETDCKCLTKLGTSVPINTVPQNTCTPYSYYSYPGSSYYYPDQYGAGYPTSGCPIATEGLIPLLKSYLEQGKSCAKQGCQCAQSYSTC